ncbi:hypothetical protein [Endozoicomonas sp. GU-1]|uniref:hypothetical protein n=1 Tax=Endozoicomonas sp. GU-1 TaxID=3009078 RepID=UPI0022B5AF61|nr:hypothetical protein [Endozoicomonas sp. GU-1]WBA83068.1 hypothetical protein O2T12_08080 [Endozoicomonas sp. GU-1]WBA85990.1 hypothetical protein O3276_22715 [Endozoicomonas sp. GU-1]
MPYSISTCPCGISPNFNTTYMSETGQDETFSLISFGSHLVSHFKGPNEFERFKTLVSENIEKIKKNRHKAKQDESPKSLLRSISILQRTCESIKFQDNKTFYHTLFNISNFNKEELDPHHADKVHETMEQAGIFLSQKKASLQDDASWVCSTQ